MFMIVEFLEDPSVNVYVEGRLYLVYTLSPFARRKDDTDWLNGVMGTLLLCNGVVS